MLNLFFSCPFLCLWRCISSTKSIEFFHLGWQHSVLWARLSSRPCPELSPPVIFTSRHFPGTPSVSSSFFEKVFSFLPFTSGSPPVRHWSHFRLATLYARVAEAWIAFSHSLCFSSSPVFSSFLPAFCHLVFSCPLHCTYVRILFLVHPKYVCLCVCVLCTLYTPFSSFGSFLVSALVSE